MSYWIVTKGGVTEYRGAAKPEKRDDGSLVLPNGRLIPEPYTLTGPHDGDPPDISGKGSVPPRPGRPERINPAGGFGPGNTR